MTANQQVFARDTHHLRSAGIARRRRSSGLLLAWALSIICAAAGCSSGSSTVATPPAPTGQVNLLMTNLMTGLAPTGVSILSYQVTISSAVLNPGGAELLNTPLTVELTRLQTSTSLLSTVDADTGTYTSLALTFTNTSLTFKNDTGSALLVGGVTCGVGQICTASPALTAVSGSVPLPGAGLTMTSGSEATLLLDMNLAEIFSPTLSADADLLAASSVSEIVPASGAPYATIDDVVGVVGAKGSDSQGSYFNLETSTLGTYTVHVSSGTSPTAFSNFPTSASCATPGFSCLVTGQIVSVNMNFFPTLEMIASNIFFEDADTSLPEVEGLVVATTGLSAPAQLQFVVLQETPAVAGLEVGSVVNVAPSTSPAAVFDVDNLGASIVTSNYSFASAADLMVGQQVQVQRLSISTDSLIDTSRVRLRSSQFTAKVSNTAAPNFFVNSLPSFFGDAGIAQLQVNTGSDFTEFGGSVISASQIAIGRFISFRIQLFQNGSTPVGAATAVIEH